MMYRWLTFILLAGVLISWTHPFHASVTTARLNGENLEIEIKVFTDDLVLALEKAFEHTYDFNEQEQVEGASAHLSTYFGEKLQFGDSTPEQLGYVGMESEYDLTYLYFEIPDFEMQKELFIRNTCFMELFDDQNNIVNMMVGEELESVFLTPDKSRKQMKFKLTSP